MWRTSRPLERCSISALIALCLLGSSSCKKDDEEPNTQSANSVDTLFVYDTVIVIVDTVAIPPNSVVDVDGNVYPTTVIGDKRWMAENLRTGNYSNGDPIPYIPDGTQWASLTSGAWSNYDSDAAYDLQYGKLYNWYTVVDPRNVCPAGWHVPSDEDWMDLEQTLGVPISDLDLTGSRGLASNAGGHMKALSLWNSPNAGADDSSGFSGYPGGLRPYNGGAFGNLAISGYWWSTSEMNAEHGWLRNLSWNNPGIFRGSNFKGTGASIRCVQD